MHEFETFHRHRASPSAEPLVTIQRRGTISLNAAAFRALGSPAAVELLYHVDDRIVGLRSVDPHVSHSYLVRSASRAGSGPYVVSAAAFVRYYEIDTSTAQRWVAYVDDGKLCIDLRTQGAPVPRPAGRASTASGAEPPVSA